MCDELFEGIKISVHKIKSDHQTAGCISALSQVMYHYIECDTLAEYEVRAIAEWFHKQYMDIDVYRRDKDGK